MNWVFYQAEVLAHRLFTEGWNLWDLGWAAIFALMTLEEMGLPAPLVSDAVVLAIGYSSGLGQSQALAKFLILLFLVVASSLTGASAVYWAARFGSRPLLERITARVGARGYLARVEAWLSRRGSAVIILARLTPGLLTASSVVAGTLRVPYLLFCLYVTISAAIWAGIIFALGLAAGRGATTLLPPEQRVWLLQLLVGLVLVVALLWLVRRLASAGAVASHPLGGKTSRALRRVFPWLLPGRPARDEDGSVSA